MNPLPALILPVEIRGVTETGSETVSVKAMDEVDMTFESDQFRFIQLPVEEDA